MTKFQTIKIQKITFLPFFTHNFTESPSTINLAESNLNFNRNQRAHRFDDLNNVHDQKAQHKEIKW